MIFNAEENELLACYMPVDDRLALIKAIVKDTADMDEEIRLIAERGKPNGLCNKRRSEKRT